MMPWGALAAIAGATLVSEDLTAIAVGLGVRAGSLPAFGGVIACALGILAGDIGLWATGRVASSWGPIARLMERAPGGRSARTTSDWIEHHTGMVIVGSRLLPGTRLPLYVAAGASRRATARILGWMVLAVSVWTPVLVLGTALIGPAVAAPLERFAGTPFLARAAAGLILLTVLRLGVVLSTRTGRERLGLGMARLRRWEFWPAWVLNAPVAVWIACLAVRHRSLMVVTAANPGIADGGVVGESKSAILAGIPAPWVLPWAALAPGSVDARMSSALSIIAERGWAFPLVVKPDVGERGIGVRWVTSPESLREYLAAAAGPAILQLAHDGPFEAGIFYVRRPGEPVGRIWSITDKRFPEVEGDGVSTIGALISRHPRHRLQAPVFRARLGASLERVSAAGERVVLGRAGNHCQGTQFLDGRHLITRALEQRIDEIARGVPGFYFGRFDVRYRDVQGFRAGTDLAIVELNGLTSEAAHIYDPRYSVWNAWRTLAQQWTLAFAIGVANRARGARPAPRGRVFAAMWTFLTSRPASFAIAD